MYAANGNEMNERNRQIWVMKNNVLEGDGQPNDDSDKT